MASTMSIAFIDSSVEAYSLLMAGIKPGIRVHILDGNRNGIETITQILRQQATPHRLQDVHIIAHGSPGCLRLGNTELSLDTLEQYRTELADWSCESLLLYGCEVAAGDAGAEFVEKLHQATQAEISASTTLVGQALRGGNWELDVSTEVQHPELALRDATLANYPYTLPGPVAPDASTSSTFNAVDFQFSAVTLSHPSGNNSDLGTQGTVAFYAGVAQYQGTDIDMTITIVSTTDPGKAQFTIDSDDAKFQFSGSAVSGSTVTQLKFEFWEKDTANPATTPIEVPVSFTIKDLDKLSSSPSGQVSVLRSEVSTYGINEPTKLIPPADSTASNLVFTSTADNPDQQDSEFALQVNYESKSSINIELTAEFGNSGFIFDGDRDFNFSNLITVGGDQFTTPEGTILNVPATGVLSNDFDPDGDTLTVAEVNGDPTAVGNQITLPSGALLTVNSDGSYSYDPNGQFDNLNDGETDTDEFIYTVSDGRGGTDDATVTVTITGVTNAPPAIDLNTALTDNGHSTSTSGNVVNIADATTATGTDADGNDIETLTITVGGLQDGSDEKLVIAGSTPFPLNANQPNQSSNGFDFSYDSSTGTVSISKTGGGDLTQAEVDGLLRGLTYQNDAGTPTQGDRTFTIIANDGVNNSAPAVSTVSVVGALPNLEETFPEDSPQQSITILGPTDSGSVTIPTGPNNGNATVSGDGKSILYTPTADFSGIDTLNYQVGSDTAELKLLVTPVADAPTATANNGEGTQNQPIPVTLGGTASSDTDGSETLSFQIPGGVPVGTQFTDGTNNVGTNEGGGVWSFTPAELNNLMFVPPSGFIGPINLNFNAISTDVADLTGDGDTDDANEINTNTVPAPFTIQVNQDSDGDGTPDKDEPPVVDLNGTGDSGLDHGATFVAASGVATRPAIALADTDASASDPTTDVNGPDIESLTLNITGLIAADPEVLKVGDTSIQLTSDATFNSVPVTGASTDFTVQVSNAGATVTITKQGGGKVSDADATALLKSLGYRNDAPQPTLGDRTFAITANDGANTSAVATSTIDISADLSNNAVTLDEDDLPQSINVRSDDTLQGPISSISSDLNGQPGAGTIAINGDNINYTPAANFSGVETITYQVGSETAELKVTVRPVAETPATATSNAAGIQDAPIALTGVSGSALADTDGSETLTYTITGVPAGFTFQNGSGGTVGTPPATAGDPWTFTPTQVNDLQLIPPTGFTGTVNLSLQGTSTDTADLDGDGNTTDTGETVTAQSVPQPFSVTFQTDTDGDGVPDVTDLDDDNDGILDTVEQNGDPNRDTDGDNIIDSLDLDADGDGITDLRESGLSPTEINTLDPNGDGRIDLVPNGSGGNNFGSNGLADGVELATNPNLVDYNNDGTADSPADTDGDGVPDFQDLDSDNDGINDVVEAGGTDLDGNGLVDGGTTDSDGDGLADVVDPSGGGGGSALPVPDFDNDGVEDFRDLDSDNDGLSDLVEGGLDPAIADKNSDGVVDGPDNDSDGIQNPADGTPNTFGDSNGPSSPGATNNPLPNANGSGNPDYLNLDSDGDGDPDRNEAGLPTGPGTPDADGDGKIDTPTDSDGDGIADTVDTMPGPFGGIESAIDTDGDGVPDTEDLDDDNDGITDTDELGNNPTRDTDGDGIIDSLDLDADNDGITDLRESGLSKTEIASLDSNGDGRIDLIPNGAGGNNFGSNGLADAVETTPGSNQVDYDNDGQVDQPVDTDGDGKADFQDLDSDNDGLNDVVEAGGTDLNGDGLIDGNTTDSDNDGLADSVDPTSGGAANGSPLPVPDSDSDGRDDFRDLDSDNDGLSDLSEGGLDPAVVDPDGNGVVDGPDQDGDGIPDLVDATPSNFGDGDGPASDAVPDANSDGTPDYRTPNSDGDGTPDRIEAGLPTGPGTPDTNGDGIIDNPADSDGDGIPDSVDTQPGPFGGIASPVDTDGDGIPDVQDLDDDNDGITDADELQGNPTRDTDGDGIIDSLDLDADGDGITDLRESGLTTAEIATLDSNGDGRIDSNLPFGSNGLADGVETTAGSGAVDYNNDGSPDQPADTDGDGIADFQDLDSDNDGINDVIEAGGIDNNGDGLIDGHTTDSDGDGLADVIDPSNDSNGGSPTGASPLAVPDSDNDGRADFRDLDSDNDGLSDLSESGLDPAVVDQNGDGVVDGPESDGDGIQDPVDATPNAFGDGDGPTNSSIPDANGDGTPDYRTPDSDGDGTPDRIEAGLPTGPGTPDTNGDGIIDDPTDNDGDGIPDTVDDQPSLFGGAEIPPVTNLSGGGGGDVITGGAGQDVINGLSDEDILDGGGGDDIVNGGSEQDQVLGGDGNDINNGGSGNDQISGGNGNDLVSGGSGNDQINGDAGNDLLNGGSGADIIDGGDGQDILIGSSGDDVLLGRNEYDILQGNRGDDVLVGGGGGDALLGGQGRDTFRYDAISDFGDTIMDFEIVQDVIDLSAIYGGNGALGSTVQAMQMGSHTVLTDGSQQIALLLNVNASTIGQQHFQF